MSGLILSLSFSNRLVVVRLQLWDLSAAVLERLWRGRLSFHLCDKNDSDNLYRLFQNVCLGMWMRSMQLKAEEEKVGDISSNNTSVDTSSTFLYFVFSSVVVLICILFKAVWSVWCNIKAAQSIHDRLMYSVILAPCSWFDATPVGRIVNRFSKDISTVVSYVICWILHIQHTLLRIQVSWCI